MPHDWQALTNLTGGARFIIERVRLSRTGVRDRRDVHDIHDIHIEGDFDLPALAQLTAEDQVFVAAFVRCHGSIKEMEKLFGVSYPTIKNRLNRIGALLPFAEVAVPPPPSTSELLTQLERGDMTVRDVLAQLRPGHDDDRH